MKKYNVKFKTIQIEPNNYHFIVKIKVNKISGFFIIDTGATHTCIDINFFKTQFKNISVVENDSINMGINSNNFSTYTTVADAIQIGRLTIKKYRLILLDMTHITDLYDNLGYKNVIGIIGGDLFVSYKSQLNFSNNILTLWKEI